MDKVKHLNTTTVKVIQDNIILLQVKLVIIKNWLSLITLTQSWYIKLVWFSITYNYDGTGNERRGTWLSERQKAPALWVHKPWQKTNTHSRLRHAHWNQHCRLPSFPHRWGTWWWVAQLQENNRMKWEVCPKKKQKTKQLNINKIDR